MTRYMTGALAGAVVLGLAAPALAEKPIWGFQAELMEYRVAEGGNTAVWDFDALYGNDEIKLVWRSQGEYALEEDAFETLENQIRLQVPISTFFYAVAGVRAATPVGPDRFSGVIALRGLAPQWFEIDLELFVSDKPQVRFEAEYQVLFTNRIFLVPSIEVNLPMVDDEAVGLSGFGPTMEVGARLHYDVVDRLFSPYVGVNYERSFGGTANLARAEGREAGTVSIVVGARILY